MLLFGLITGCAEGRRVRGPLVKGAQVGETTIYQAGAPGHGAYIHHDVMRGDWVLSTPTVTVVVSGRAKSRRRRFPPGSIIYMVVNGVPLSKLTEYRQRLTADGRSVNFRERHQRPDPGAASQRGRCRKRALHRHGNRRDDPPRGKLSHHRHPRPGVHDSPPRRNHFTAAGGSHHSDIVPGAGWVLVIVDGEEERQEVLPWARTRPFAFTNPIFVEPS